ncbi:hypothetical protein [Dictyobacter halimunensis]
MNLALWIVQGFLTVLCLVSGVLKAFQPLATVHRLFSLGQSLPWRSGARDWRQ